MRENVVAIIQARMNSTRLPGKVMRPILGQPMLAWVVERVRQAQSVRRVVVATGSDHSNKPIVDWCLRNGCDLYQGSEEDVLDRYYQCAKMRSADIIVRITADCPLIAPDLINHVVGLSLDHDGDYATNTWPPTYPDGLDVEAFGLHVLATAWRKATLRSEREHVGQWMRANTPCWNTSGIRDLSAYRLTVDEPQDLALVQAIYAELGQNPSWLDAIRLLEARPELVQINADITRNEGLAKSLREDSLVG